MLNKSRCPKESPLAVTDAISGIATLASFKAHDRLFVLTGEGVA